MSATTGVTNTQSGSTSYTTKANSSLDRDAFLKLLITQLQHQDPMSPMEDKDFIAQLAQFSSLEQMQKMGNGLDSFGKSATANQAFAMTGRWVDYADVSTGTTITGKVDSVSFVDGDPVLNIGSNLVSLDTVVKVYPGAESIGKSKSSTQAFTMIGKTVDYVDYTTGTITSGKVDSVSIVDGWPKMNIGTKAIDFADVIGLHDSTGSATKDEMVAQANAMLNKHVDYLDSDGTTTRSGRVDSISLVEGWPYLMVGGNRVEVGDITKVY